MKLYRVLKKKTNSLQPGSSTYWTTEVLYCGYDRKEAMRIYHENKPDETFYGYGNRCTRIVGHSKKVRASL